MVGSPLELVTDAPCGEQLKLTVTLSLSKWGGAHMPNHPRAEYNRPQCWKTFFKKAVNVIVLVTRGQPE